mmetsp:Transcript_93761/g.268330  ORF Transcript_93761/g.268330 Transcript_93761/m.268330 type:complete len:262 (+) Transcript_93761:56-841(+)
MGTSSSRSHTAANILGGKRIETGDDSHEPGSWVRIAHGSKSVGGPVGVNSASLVLDYTLDEIMSMAQHATRVRIQSGGVAFLDGSRRAAVTSRPNSYPINDIRQGKAIGYTHIGKALSMEQVKANWEGNSGELRSLWYKGLKWGEGQFEEANVGLDHTIYHACCNGTGLCWWARPSHTAAWNNERSACSWNGPWGTGMLELLINLVEATDSGGTAADDMTKETRPVMAVPASVNAAAEDTPIVVARGTAADMVSGCGSRLF